MAHYLVFSLLFLKFLLHVFHPRAINSNQHLNWLEHVFHKVKLISVDYKEDVLLQGNFKNTELIFKGHLFNNEFRFN